jgi:IclR family pca regulon transcriptional regulator
VEFVQSLERGLAVLRTFGPEAAKLSLTEVATRTDMTRAAARRFLLTLVELGYASCDGRTYALRPKVLELGNAYVASLRLPGVAAPHLEQLSAVVRETASMTVLDGTDVVYVARVHGLRILTVSIDVGTRLPAVATSTGRVLLGALPGDELARLLDRVELDALPTASVVSRAQLLEELDRVREQGWAVTDQEFVHGLRSVAVPVRDPSTGRVVAAVNVAAHTSHASLDRLGSELLPELQRAAAGIERDLQAESPRG